MSMTLSQILSLVGKLDDSPGDETARERFRGFPRENVSEVGQVRDYIEECLRNTGDQYNRALQDLVNHIGHFLEFEVVFGRYHGVQGQIGFDGHWKSSEDFHIVVEVKTSEVYSIKTSTLVGYVDELISAHDYRIITRLDNSINNEILDSLELFCLAFPQLSSHRLEKLAEHFGYIKDGVKMGKLWEYIDQVRLMAALGTDSTRELFHTAPFDCLVLYLLLDEVLDVLKGLGNTEGSYV